MALDDLNRRTFLHHCTVGAAVGFVGTQILAQVAASSAKQLRTLNNRPLNAEAAMHDLDDLITPTSRMFVRNNGLVPPLARGTGVDQWRLRIDGEVSTVLELSLKELRHSFPQYTYQLVLECGGNGRAGYYPPTPGNQWTYGAVCCPLWHGVRLRDVLAAAESRRAPYTWPTTGTTFIPAAT